MSKEESERIARPTRVKQLDANLLDNELYGLLFSQLSNVMKHIEFNKTLLYELRPEFECLIKVYISYNSLLKNTATVGQSLLELRLIDSTQYRVKYWKFYAYVMISAIIPWFRERFTREKMVQQTETVYRTLDLINFIAFLNRGEYPTIWQRVLKLDAMHYSKDNVLGVQYDSINRELLWHGFAQLLTFVLPLISLQRIKNSISSLLSFYLKPNIRSVTKKRTKSDAIVCAICTNWPNNPFEIGCNHIFCYYCIASNFLSDTKHGFNCPHCLKHVSSLEQITQLRISILD